MPHTDEGDYCGGFHEIDMAPMTAQQCPGAVSKGRRRAERHECVHVRAAVLELPPCAAVERSAGEHLDDGRDAEGKPLEPGGGVEAKNPLAKHQGECSEHAEPKIGLPAGELVRAMIVCWHIRLASLGYDFFCRVAGILDRPDDCHHGWINALAPAN